MKNIKKIRYLIFILFLLIMLNGCKEKEEPFEEHYLTDIETAKFLTNASFSFDESDTYKVYANINLDTTFTENGVTKFFGLNSTISAIVEWPDTTDDHQAVGDITTSFHVGRTGETGVVSYDFQKLIDGSFAVQDGYVYADVLTESRDLRIRTSRPIIDQEFVRDVGYDIGAIDDQLKTLLFNSIAALDERVYQTGEDTYIIYFDHVSIDYAWFTSYVQSFYGVSDYNMTFLLDGIADMEMLVNIKGNTITSVNLGMTAIQDTFGNYFQLTYSTTNQDITYPDDLNFYRLQDALISTDYVANIAFHVGDDYPYYVFATTRTPNFYTLVGSYEKPGYYIEGFYLDEAFTERIEDYQFEDVDNVITLNVYVHYIDSSEASIYFEQLLTYDSYTLKNDTDGMMFVVDELATYFNPGTSGYNAMYEDHIEHRAYYVDRYDINGTDSMFVLETKTSIIDIFGIIETWLDEGIPVTVSDQYVEMKYNGESIKIDLNNQNKLIVDLADMSATFIVENINNTITQNIFDNIAQDPLDRIANFGSTDYMFENKALLAYTADDVDTILSYFRFGFFTESNHYKYMPLEDLVYDLDFIAEPGDQQVTLTIADVSVVVNVFFFDPDSPMIVMGVHQYSYIYVNSGYVSDIGEADIYASYQVSELLTFDGFYYLNDDGIRIENDLSGIDKHTFIYPIISVKLPIDTSYLNNNNYYFDGYMNPDIYDQMTFMSYGNYLFDAEYINNNSEIVFTYYFLAEQKKYEMVYSTTSNLFETKEEVVFDLPEYYLLIEDIKTVLKTKLPLESGVATLDPYYYLNNEFVHSGYIQFEPADASIDIGFLNLSDRSNGRIRISLNDQDDVDYFLYNFYTEESLYKENLQSTIQLYFDYLVEEGLIDEVIIE